MIEGGTGGIGKAAQELMQEMQKAQQEIQNKEGGQQIGGANEGFQNAMQQAQGVQPSNQVQGIQTSQQINPTQQASNILMQARADSNLPSTRVGEAAKTQRSQMANMLDQLVGGQDKMSQVMQLAMSGKQFSSQEMLALQAGVYRFSQELDLMGKVIEKSTSGIKQTMNTQV